MKAGPALLLGVSLFYKQSGRLFFTPFERHGIDQFNRLSRACGLSQSTIGNIFRRQTVPSLSTLEAICRGFGMTLGQFFAEGNVTEVTGSTKELLDAWMPLTPEQKKAVLQLVQVMNQKDGASSSID